MKPVLVYRVRSRRGLHLETIRSEEAAAYARRIAHRPPFALPAIEQVKVAPKDHTAKEAA